MGKSRSKTAEGEAGLAQVKGLRIFISRLSSASMFLITFIRGMSRVGQIITAVMLLGLMFLVTFDVSGRYFLSLPIKGTYELSKFLLVGVVAFSIAYTQAAKGHVRAELIIGRLSFRKQNALDALFSLIGIIFFVLIVIQSVKQATYDLQTNLVSDILRIPAFPFKLFIPVGGTVMVLELLIDFSRHVKQSVRGG